MKLTVRQVVKKPTLPDPIGRGGMEPGLRALQFWLAHVVLRYDEPADNVVSGLSSERACVPETCQIERSTTVTGGSLRRPRPVTAVAVRRGAGLA